MLTTKSLSNSILNGVGPFLWVVFISVFASLIILYPDLPNWTYGSLVSINGFTLLLWSLVSFFSALVHTYAKNYLKGFKYHNKFTLICLTFTASIMVFVMANHVAILLSMWLLMGICMSQLIGVDSRWGEAREASKFALKYFLSGSFFLSLGVLTLAIQLDDFTLKGINASINLVPSTVTFFAALCIITAALIQSAIYPFHRWLLSAMTAPTPASALMHAGFVNGSGLLLTLFSSVLFASNTLVVLFVIGGLTAVIAQFAKLLQVNVKQKLACSTIAQMGFMIMQCGLGFFNAAIVHLILHGFYKAYLFLSANEEIGSMEPKSPSKIQIKPIQLVLVLGYGVVGALVFAFATGKTSFVDSGIFLTLIVAITVGQTTYNIVKEKSLSIGQRIVLPPVLFIAGIFSYAWVYNVVSRLIDTMPMVEVPLPLSAIEIVFGLLFLFGFFIMKLGVYRNYPRLYMWLSQSTQPSKRTILMYKSN